MHTALTTLIDRLDRPEMSGTDVIHWGAPVPSFGDLSRARVATLGLNPSNREFVDDQGGELQGAHRRFHTLNSLGLKSWADVDSRHLYLIMDSCRTYFLGNPYDRWFKRLDQIIADTEVSYYNTSAPACHLDLIPYATVRKWADLTFQQRSSLLRMAGDTLALLLRDSPVRVLILNGASVVDHFQQITGISLRRCEMNEWTLHRENNHNVLGFGYEGFVTSLCGVRLSDRVLVLGYNHNIQSSFGISTNIVTAIRRWVAQRVSKVRK